MHKVVNKHSMKHSEDAVRCLLTRVYSGDIDGHWFVRQGMQMAELSRLHELVSAVDARQTLEVGMAMGTSSVTILDALSSNDGSLLSIDPFQTATAPTGFDNGGIQSVKRAGYSERHSLIEKPSYVALPELLEQRRSFDFILIDGWHSFDFTLVDYFYSDLLLNDGGVVVFHDSNWPSVFRVTRFLETHKPYELLSPPPHQTTTSMISKIINRCRRTLDGTRKQRRERWHSLAAYRKVRYEQADQRSSLRF